MRTFNDRLASASPTLGHVQSCVQVTGACTGTALAAAAEVEAEAEAAVAGNKRDAGCHEREDTYTPGDYVDTDSDAEDMPSRKRAKGKRTADAGVCVACATPKKRADQKQCCICKKIGSRVDRQVKKKWEGHEGTEGAKAAMDKEKAALKAAERAEVRQVEMAKAEAKVAEQVALARSK